MHVMLDANLCYIGKLFIFKYACQSLLYSSGVLYMENILTVAMRYDYRLVTQVYFLTNTLLLCCVGAPRSPAPAPEARFRRKHPGSIGKTLPPLFFKFS